MNYRSRRAGSIILGLISAAGTVFTAILVAKETPKALEKIKVLKTKGNIKKIDYAKELIPIYWPAGVVCLGAVASTTISQVMSIKTEASLIATSTMLSQGWNKYKYKVKDVFGKKADEAITNQIAIDDHIKQNPKLNSDEQLFWEEHIGFFKCKEKDLIGAMSDLNQRLHTPDPNPNGTFYWTSLYYLLKDAKAKVLEESKLEASKEIGWTTDYLCEVYDLGCMWVHPFYTKIIKKETGEVLFTKISFFEEPIFLHESERSRYNYKSREDYAHESEIDMHDADALALYSHGYEDYDAKSESIRSALVNSKPDCDPVEDSGRRFISTNGCSNFEYLEDDKSFPSEKDIPSIEDVK